MLHVHLVSLGCARNLVDSEVMTGLLVADGFQMTDDPEIADAVIINTCGFIEDAVTESIETILDLARYKEEGRLRYLIVVGCLAERYQKDIAASLPEVDLFLGTGAYDQVSAALKKLENQTLSAGIICPSPASLPLQEAHTPRLIDSSHMAYVKIAEGCSSRCTYCIIPKLRGAHRSREIADIRQECVTLLASGIREIVLVAQESTFYGVDLAPPVGLDTLLEDLAAIDKTARFRVLYGHPLSLNDRMIQVMGRHENICAYFDLPVQHASPSVLRKMGRSYDTDFLRSLFQRIRNAIPDAAIRTTLITGFPGETEGDFQCLYDFINDIRFDHLGVFVYSDADDLPSHHLPDHVPAEVAAARQDRLMARQAEISLEKNQKHLNKTYTILVEEHPEESLYIGRTVFQAPEVDGVTIVRGKALVVGDFTEVHITDASEYDISGEAI